jgi:hypothetical protein
VISVLLQFIPLALAAIAPGLLLVAILLLGTQNGLRKVIAFTLGKYLAYIGWGIVLLILSDVIASAGGIETPTMPAALKLILGVLLLVLAGRSLVGEDDPDAPPPKWMAALEKPSAAALFGIGVLLSVVQIRFVLLMIAGVTMMGTAALSSAETVVLLLVLSLCMVWPLLIPIAIYVLAGEQTEEALAATNQWLTRNQRWINFFVLLLFGIVLLVNGLMGLGVIGA